MWVCNGVVSWTELWKEEEDKGCEGELDEHMDARCE
jgi:hypothetical protein